MNVPPGKHYPIKAGGKSGRKQALLGPLVIGMQDGFEISANWAAGRVVRWPVKRARYPKHD